MKSTIISQLVNDHLHISQKRRDGSSLVVETGFPTSLIDLFFKNREKLKKPSKKKRRNPPTTSSDDVYDPAIVASPLSYPSPPPPPPPSLVGSPMPRRHSSVLPSPPSCVDEICVAGSSGSGSSGGAVDVVDEEERGGESGGDVNGVLMGVLKIFVVVVLALATKRLTVGITISAVLLLFLEYVGKHYRVLSTPCAAAKAAVMSMVQSGGRLLRYKKLEQQQSLKSSASRFPDQEIQAVESKGYSTAGVDEIQPAKETVSKSISRNRLGYQEIELLEMAMKREESMRDAADSNRKSRKARIKSKMQKIVPKKFRRSRKEQEFHSPPIVKDEGVVLYEEQCDIGEEYENGSISSSSVSDGSYREEDNKNTICFDRRLSDVNEEADTKIEEKGTTEAALARRYMLLCLIVLVGLIGGRAFALVLTLSWFLLLKLGQKLLPRSG